LRTVRAQCRAAPLIYFGDNAHIPYGSRPLAEVCALSEGIARFLAAHGAEIIVVACNTASAAALKHLRVTFPHLPFVGMEPAVKPAAEHTQTRIVGVLATPATFQGELFNSVVERFAQGVTVLTQTCPGLVQQIEAGELASPRTEAMLREWLTPMLVQGIDALVLGCTHYPFVIPLLEKICGPTVRVIDPAPAVARQTLRLAQIDPGLCGDERGPITYWTTGAVRPFEQALATLGLERGAIHSAAWGPAMVVSERLA
jgi:glutamate racemase